MIFWMESETFVEGRTLTGDERLRNEDIYMLLERIILLEEVSWR
jgi:hypothetical protein